MQYSALLIRTVLIISISPGSWMLDHGHGTAVLLQHSTGINT